MQYLAKKYTKLKDKILKADILGSPHNSSQFNTAKCKVRVYRSVTRDEINEVCN